jgi:hypothetical protein
VDDKESDWRRLLWAGAALCRLSTRRVNACALAYPEVNLATGVVVRGMSARCRSVVALPIAPAHATDELGDASMCRIPAHDRVIRATRGAAGSCRGAFLMSRHVGLRRWAFIVVGVLVVPVLLTTVARAGAPPASLQQAPVCSWQTLGDASKGVYYPAAAMDTVNHHLYLYGGLDQSLEAQDALQRIDLSGSALAPAPHSVVTGVPAPKRFGAAGAFRVKGVDSAAYFIGGAEDVQTGNGSADVQVFQTPARQWSTIAPSGTFEDRLFHAAAYDPSHDVIWVTGGISKCGLPDIQADRCPARAMPTKYLAFDATTGAASWQPLGGTGGPTMVYGHVMVYDPTGKRLIAIGGTRDGRQGSNDVWFLDLSDPDVTKARWSDVSPLGATFPRVALHAAAYDAGRNWVLVYGGVVNNFNTPNENINTATYALDLTTNPPVWVNLSASLQQRVGAVMAYDDVHQVVVLSAGRRASKASPPQGVERDTSALVCSNQPTVLPPPVTSGPSETPVPGATTPSAPTNTPVPGATTPSAPTVTPMLPPPVTSVPTPPVSSQVCKFILRFDRVPAQAIADALANPARVYGWQMSCNASVPPGMFNRPRTYLSVHNIAVAYHPLWNALEYKCGCP